MTVIRAAISQTGWTGDEASMIDRHEGFAHDAAKQGAQLMCFQELFHGPCVGITRDPQYHRFARPADGGPILMRFQSVAKELGMVLVLPIYEEEQAGVYYDTALVVDADGGYLGKYRRIHVRNAERFWETSHVRPGNLGYPVFETAVGPIGAYLGYDRHFPEGWREYGLGGAHLVVNPNAAESGPDDRLWEIEGPAAAVANGCFVLQPNRVGTERDEDGSEVVVFHGTSQVIDPRGDLVGERGSAAHEELLVRDLDMGLVREMRDSRPFHRDRRPETYVSIALQ